MNIAQRIFFFIWGLIVISSFFYVPYEVTKYHNVSRKTIVSSTMEAERGRSIFSPRSLEVRKSEYKWINEHLLLYEWIEFHLVFTPPLREMNEDGVSYKFTTYRQRNWMLQLTIILSEICIATFLFLLFRIKKK